MEFLSHFIITLWQLSVAMAPYLLLGFLFAGILKVWFPQKWIDRYMGKSNFKSVFNTALLGIPLPLCSCGVIPTGISFYRTGASKGASVSFLISTPQTGVDSILVTYSLLGLPFAIIRVVVALVTGIAGGIFTNWFDKSVPVAENVAAQSCTPTSKTKIRPFFRVFQYGFFEFLMDIAKWLVIGVILAALFAVFIPDDFFSNHFTNEPLSMLAVLFASIPLYICATASVPVAAVLIMKGLSPGAALVLLMAGPATNIATITIIKKVFGNKTLLAYLGSITAGAMLFGLAINAFLPREWFVLAPHVMHNHNHELLPYWFQAASAIVLILLIINGYIQRWITNHKLPVTAPIKTQSQQPIPFKMPANGFTGFKPLTTKKYEVHGMTCNHCKNSVETHLSALSGITSVTANPQLNLVIVTGSSIIEEQIKTTIESLGYSFKKKIS